MQAARGDGDSRCGGGGLEVVGGDGGTTGLHKSDKPAPRSRTLRDRAAHDELREVDYCPQSDAGSTNLKTLLLLEASLLMG